MPARYSQQSVVAVHAPYMILSSLNHIWQTKKLVVSQQFLVSVWQGVGKHETKEILNEFTKKPARYSQISTSVVHDFR